jgi:hypothetical protein
MIIKNILFGSLLLLITNIHAQKEVRFKINHYMDGQVFEMEKKLKNNLGNQLDFTRLDYFISQITLHHDGGVKEEIKDTYIFVSKGLPVNQVLGNFNIGVLDSITFFVGVDSVSNHSDPTLWPAGHALAPRSPDMHWGWAAGYRFAAIEGSCGDNLVYSYQIHALSDLLYNKTTIVTKGIETQDGMLISIDADYAKSVYDINMNKNVFIHGSTKEAKPLLSNFNKRVFTASSPTSWTQNYKPIAFNVFPNPSLNGNIYLDIEESMLVGSKLSIKDVLGRNVSLIQNVKNKMTVDIEQPGIYFLELIKNGQITHTSKWIKR